MRHTLVGYTGFVGGNLAAAHAFDGLYNSANIADSFGADNGLVVYSGMPAEKFTANADPEGDLARARGALQNIERMSPEKLVLISTVDVYPRPMGVYEDSPIDEGDAQPYGKHRYLLETWVRELVPDALILRLPGLFGKGLKKNFIYDIMNPTPSVLTEEKYNQQAPKSPLVAQSYAPDGSGFWRLNQPDTARRVELHNFFVQNDFNALCFTDSRSVFQFYDLACLWRDIERCLKAGLHTVNLATQPVEAGALYHALFGDEFENHLPKGPVWYDMRTRHGRTLGGDDDYIADRAEVLAGIAKFVAAEQM